MTGNPVEAAAAYFAAWKARDFRALRTLLADDVTFAGPLGQADGRDDCVRGIERMSEIMTGIVIQQICTDGRNVITWFDLHTNVALPCPVANWTQVGEDGKITRIRAAFDPRPILAGAGG